MDLLISLLIFCLIASLIWYLITRLPLPEPFKLVAECVLIIIAIVWLVGYLPHSPLRL